jgi:hypothetical protein
MRSIISVVTKIGNGLHFLFYDLKFANNKFFVLISFLLFCSVAVFGISIHEMWRDELDVWLVCLGSDSIGEMFFINRNNGHPSLWYLIIYFVKYLSSNVLVMQVLHVGIAAVSVYGILRYAPFSQFVKLLFCTSYFVFYEYTIVCRAYGLGIMLMIVALILLNSHFKYKKLSLLFALVLLSHTSIWGLIMAMSMMGAFVLEHIYKYRKNLKDVSLIFLPVLVFVLSATLSIYDIKPTDTAVMPFTYVDGWDVQRFIFANASITHAFFPNVDFTWYYFPGVFILILTIVYVRKNMLSSLLIIISMLGFFGFLYLTGKGDLRYLGNIFIIPFLALWINEKSPIKRGNSRLLVESLFLLVLFVSLVYQSYVGISSYIKDYKLPFSYTYELSKVIEDNDFDGVPVLGTIDFLITPLAAFVDNPIFVMENKREQKHMIWDVNIQEYKNELDYKEAILYAIDNFYSRKDRLLLANHKPLVAIINGKQQALEKTYLRDDVYLEFVYRLDDPVPVWTDEVFYLYEILIKQE